MPAALALAALVGAACSGSGGTSGSASPTTASVGPAAESTSATLQQQAPATSSTSPGPVVTAGAVTTVTPVATTVDPNAPSTLPRLPANKNVYDAAGANQFSPAVAGARRLVYVPSAKAGHGIVEVIDQDTLQVVDTFDAGSLAQHVVPSWDLKTLYVTASGSNRLVPIDPTTGKPGPGIKVARPYNLYFTPDGTKAVVQAEQLKRIDYYDPHTWQLLSSVKSGCSGNNHADWSADGTYFLVTCEFSGELLKVDTASGEIIAKLALGYHAMPQDVRLVPDGSKFYVADMANDGVWIVDGATFQVTGLIPTGRGAHGIYPSRDGRSMYVANRGRHMNEEGRRSHEGDGSVSVVDPTTDTVTATWTIPGGGSPDMGGVSADGTRLWLSGRYDAEVYVFDTTTGALITRIPTQTQPHGLLVWPQPGRYSLGHTGNMR